MRRTTSTGARSWSDYDARMVSSGQGAPEMM